MNAICVRKHGPAALCSGASHVVLLAAALVVIAAMFLVAKPASAGPGYDPRYRYCVSGVSPALGPDIPDCSYNDWEECRFSASGHGYCIENPVYAGQKQRRKR